MAESTRHSLYDGRINIFFKENPYHTYTDEFGRKLTSVTSVTGLLDKPALKFWAVGLACDYLTPHVGEMLTPQMLEEAKKQHTQRTAEAASSGTAVHEWVNKYLTTGPHDLPTDEKVLNGVLAFLSWIDEHKIQFVSSERLVYSVEHDFVGMADAEAIIDGTRRLVDFKTGKAKKDGGVYDEHKLQTAAYQGALMEEGVEFGGPRVLAHFDKETGAFNIHEVDDFQETYKAFLGLLAVKKWQSL